MKSAASPRRAWRSASVLAMTTPSTLVQGPAPIRSRAWVGALPLAGSRATLKVRMPCLVAEAGSSREALTAVVGAGETAEIASDAGGARHEEPRPALHASGPGEVPVVAAPRSAAEAGQHCEDAKMSRHGVLTVLIVTQWRAGILSRTRRRPGPLDARSAERNSAVDWQVACGGGWISCRMQKRLPLEVA